MLNNQDIFTVRVERIAAGGAGVARIAGLDGSDRFPSGSGLTVFVDFSAPGDLISVRIKALHKNWAEAELLGIEEPSPARTAPQCFCYGRCGGCSLQHLAYNAQLTEKAAILQDALTRIGGLGSLPEIKTTPSPPYAYRNRVQLHKDPVSGKSGFKGRRGGEIVPVEDCPVAVGGIRRFLKNSREEAPDAARFALYSQGELLLCGAGPEKNTAGNARENTDTITKGDGVLSEKPRYPGRGRVRVLDREIGMDADVFFQSNAAMLEKLIPGLLAAAEKADPNLPAADIYCGVGTFAVFLQDRFRRIDLVEENRTALALARENAAGKGSRFFARTADEWARDIRRGDPDGYGFAVLDPPRQGLSRGCRDYLAGKGPPVLAYVSCDPASLARDTRALLNGGYRLESLAFYDFYPQTPHIESLAVLTREK
ncbi:MAG: TRAM domain-containing protein [Treponema sp.]|jgi:23S rRNA (uracil1939-C5)-methyltransferase|nr:TRAM domain-containing protein [Treponema sp.]